MSDHLIAEANRHAKALTDERNNLVVELNMLREWQREVIQNEKAHHAEREDANARAELAEAECLEQARLLGMSGEREADLLGKLGRLESELAAIKHGHGELGKYEQLRLKNAELQKDKARLDWLEANPEAVKASSVFKSSFGRKVWWYSGGGNYDTARAAIDASMKNESNTP